MSWVGFLVSSGAEGGTAGRCSSSCSCGHCSRYCSGSHYDEVPICGAGLPRLPALTDQIFLSLFGLLALVSGRLVMDVMLFVVKEFGKPLNGVLVDQGVVLIDRLLPFGLSLVTHVICSLPCH